MKAHRRNSNREKRIGLPSPGISASRRRIILERNAFLGLILSGIETYRHECYGMLLGQKRRGITYVEGAMPYQTARRSPRSVLVPERRRKLIGKALGELPNPEFLGEFHSHVDLTTGEACARLSTEDMDGVSDREIQILIAMKPCRATLAWRHNRDGSLSGSMGEFFLKLRGFESIARAGRTALPRVATLRCNYAVKDANHPPHPDDAAKRLKP